MHHRLFIQLCQSVYCRKSHIETICGKVFGNVWSDNMAFNCLCEVRTRFLCNIFKAPYKTSL